MNKGIRHIIRQYASQPDGCGLFDFPGLTPHQVAQNAAFMPEIFVVGQRKQRRLFTSAVAAGEYSAALPGILAKAAEDRREKDRATRRERKAEIRAAKPPKQPKPKLETTKKAMPGVSIPRYVGMKWDQDTPADYSRAKKTVCPSPPHFGPMAKLHGIGAKA